MFSLKDVEKPLVLHCFLSKMLKNHWFYCVFTQKHTKTIGFIAFSLKNVEKPLVLWCFRSKMLKKQLVLLGFHWKCWKTIGFIVFSFKKLENHWFYCVFVQKYVKTFGFFCCLILPFHSFTIDDLFERKHNKTNGFSTFLNENTIKPMVFQHLWAKT